MLTMNSILFMMPLSCTGVNMRSIEIKSKSAFYHITINNEYICKGVPEWQITDRYITIHTVASMNKQRSEDLSQPSAWPGGSSIWREDKARQTEAFSTEKRK